MRCEALYTHEFRADAQQKEQLTNASRLITATFRCRKGVEATVVAEEMSWSHSNVPHVVEQPHHSREAAPACRPHPLRKLLLFTGRFAGSMARNTYPTAASHKHRCRWRSYGTAAAMLAKRLQKCGAVSPSVHARLDLAPITCSQRCIDGRPMVSCLVELQFGGQLSFAHWTRTPFARVSRSS